VVTRRELHHEAVSSNPGTSQILFHILVVMRWDSCTEGRGFKSQHCILDGHFSHLFAEKNVMFLV